MNTNLGTLRTQRFHQLATLAAALFLTLPLAACGFGENPQKAETPPGPVENFMILSTPGQTTVVDDVQFGQGVNVSVDEVFTSAKGENCKRGTVLAGQKEAEVVVICQDEQGRWIMAPRVWGQGISKP
ncbi:MAG: DVU3141 family protein [Desulfovibrio sp.]|uniref:DVU3141 family protein n=1 Tax=Desulfovibrio sp. TaxID=885 RepID=UPI002A36916F|nr:DVU3141 family protein [Desulfovibrio sp.]MDY0260637.1 DVU3141 family protein [Desulfovibrio sp.]